MTEYATAKRKRTNNDIQNITHKIKDRATRKAGDELRYTERVISTCSTCDTRCVTIKRLEHHLMWKSRWTSVKKKITNNMNKT